MIRMKNASIYILSVQSLWEYFDYSLLIHLRRALSLIKGKYFFRIRKKNFVFHNWIREIIHGQFSFLHTFDNPSVRKTPHQPNRNFSLSWSTEDILPSMLMNKIDDTIEPPQIFVYLSLVCVTSIWRYNYQFVTSSLFMIDVSQRKERKWCYRIHNTRTPLHSYRYLINTSNWCMTRRNFLRKIIQG